ncbi:hypothetical protein HYU92_05370 [Candidatus Curtissbacteria bacterium]|nr:hypothetical protein [Candidatus Curtissbacteria bacterium]
MGEGQSDEKREKVELDKYSSEEIVRYLRDKLSKDPTQFPNPNALSLLDQIINYQANEQVEENSVQTETEASEWANKIKYHFLRGKFGNGWQTRNGPLRFDYNTSDFKSTEVKGSFTIPSDWIVDRNYKNIKAMGLLVGYFYEVSKQRDKNFLIVSAPSADVNRAIGLREDYVPLQYLMWSHKDATPDARGNHVPLSFYFFLPEQEAKAFLEKIGKNPDLIENVFQLQHPGLVAQGQVQRVRVDQLSRIDVETATAKFDLLTNPPGNPYAITSVTPKETLNFKNPVGEMPG